MVSDIPVTVSEIQKAQTENPSSAVFVTTQEEIGVLKNVARQLALVTGAACADAERQTWLANTCSLAGHDFLDHPNALRWPHHLFRKAI